MLKKKPKSTGVSETELVRQALEARLCDGAIAGLDLSAWEEEKKFIEQLIRQRKASDRKTDNQGGRTCDGMISMNRVNYLLLGAGGQLGTAFRSLLRERGQEYLAFDQELDITDFGRLRQIFDDARPDVAINCAAYNNVDRAEAEWRQAFVVNGIAVGGLARVAREYGCVLAHYSTD
jgi:hypothetical protein